MSILISELCERDVLEIDWEKLAVDNSSVYDIYTGLSMDEAQMKNWTRDKGEAHLGVSRV